MASTKGRTLDTYQCPQCGKTLLAGVQMCQFCGTSTAVRPKSGSTQASVRKTSSGISFDEICFFLVALIWVGTGAFDIAGAFGKAQVLIEPFGGVAYFGMLAGFRGVLGLGMLFRVDMAAAIARIVSVIQMALSAVTVILALVNGVNNPLGMAYHAGHILIAFFLFYLVGAIGD